MDHQSVLQLGRQALEITVLIATPILLTILIIGLVVSIFQAATQINEMTLSFIPKLIGLGILLLITGGWMLEQMTDYMRRLLSDIPFLIG